MARVSAARGAVLGCEGKTHYGPRLIVNIIEESHTIGYYLSKKISTKFVYYQKVWKLEDH